MTINTHLFVFSGWENGQPLTLRAKTKRTSMLLLQIMRCGRSFRRKAQKKLIKDAAPQANAAAIATGIAPARTAPETTPAAPCTQ